MAASDLTTLANAKQWLGVTVTTDDALLTRLVTAASNFMQTWMNRQIANQSYSETRNGTGGQRLMLANYPVTAVASLYISGIQILPTTYPMNGYQTPGFLFDTTQLYLVGYDFCRGPQNIAVSYTAGFASTPLELEQACIELIGMKYREKDRIGLHSKVLAGETINYVIADMPDSVLAVLDNYKKVIPL